MVLKYNTNLLSPKSIVWQYNRSPEMQVYNSPWNNVPKKSCKKLSSECHHLRIQATSVIVQKPKRVQGWKIRDTEFDWWDCVDPVPLLTICEAGRSPIAKVFCMPSTPEPTITWQPTEGTPLTTTKMKAGPGTKMAGFGGTWLTCNTAVLFIKPVYVFSSWR